MLFRKKSGNTPFKAHGIFSFAFPDSEDFPAISAKLGEVALIAFDVTCALSLPEFGVRLWCDAPPATTMHMPIATMNVNNSPATWENEIGCAREVAAMETESIAERMSGSPNNNLRLCVLTPDGGHVPAALLWCMHVH